MFAKDMATGLVIGVLLCGVVGAASAASPEKGTAEGSKVESSKTDSAEKKERVGIFLKKRYRPRGSAWTAPPLI